MPRHIVSFKPGSKLHVYKENVALKTTDNGQGNTRTQPSTGKFHMFLILYNMTKI